MSAYPLRYARYTSVGPGDLWGPPDGDDEPEPLELEQCVCGARCARLNDNFECPSCAAQTMRFLALRHFRPGFRF